jgi:hypothetical protein
MINRFIVYTGSIVINKMVVDIYKKIKKNIVDRYFIKKKGELIKINRNNKENNKENVYN